MAFSWSAGLNSMQGELLMLTHLEGAVLPPWLISKRIPYAVYCKRVRDVKEHGGAQGQRVLPFHVVIRSGILRCSSPL
jgi:hypothetical protein